ncbi:MAG: hypothetical protein JST12_03225 [Armatimonadetes bacterium]|nr:hypothetical protein [Armatimonadota bacterium]
MKPYADLTESTVIFTLIGVFLAAELLIDTTVLSISSLTYGTIYVFILDGAKIATAAWVLVSSRKFELDRTGPGLALLLTSIANFMCLTPLMMGDYFGPDNDAHRTLLAIETLHMGLTLIASSVTGILGLTLLLSPHLSERK